MPASAIFKFICIIINFYFNNLKICILPKNEHFKHYKKEIKYFRTI